MAQQFPFLTHSSTNQYTLASPAAAPFTALTTGSPALGSSTSLPSTSLPRRPSVPQQSSSFAQPGTPLPSAHALPASTSAHQQALLYRAQQGARTSLSSATANPSSPFLPLEGGPPHKVAVHGHFARVRETEPGEPFPSISEADQPRVKAWIERDLAYEVELEQAKQTRAREAKERYEGMMTEQDWLGPLHPQPQGKLRLRFPEHKVQEEAKGKRGSLRAPVPLSKSQLRAAASTPERLIPVRIDLEHEVYKLRDTFTWNLEETAITPELFAQHLLADLRFPQEPFLKQMVASIRKQITDAQLHANFDAHFDSTIVGNREESRRWFEERARKRRRLGKGREYGELEVSDAELREEGEDPVELAQLAIPPGGTEELRVMIRLDIMLDTIQLVDKFEWDMSNPDNSPEQFADMYAAELGLTGEFVTSIAHTIREQVDVFARSLCLLNYTKGGVISDDDLRREFLPSLLDPFRTEAADAFTPLLNQLTRDDVDRQEKEHDREARRKRRQTKGRGVVLPDREPVRTCRTLLPRTLRGLVSFEIDPKGNKTYHLPELNEPFPLINRRVPPKPANLDLDASSPLKLLPQKDRPGAASSLVGIAAANRARKGQEGAKLPAALGESPVKRKKPPIIKPSADELGLHEHVVDGLWFCANCGCPQHVAVGRRKGPTGKDSLCGICGTHFHRFKRQRPCVYSRDPEAHRQVQAEQQAKTTAKSGKKRTAEGALVDSLHASNRSTPAAQAMSPGSAALELDDDSDASSSASPRKPRRGNYYGSPDTPFVQLDSDDSVEEESAGGPSPPPSRRGASPPFSPPPPQAALPVASQTHAPPAAAAVPTGPQPLPWMLAATAELRAKHVDERFQIIPRPRPADTAVAEWRIRCLDCPGKLYNLGPGETLDGFLVHFKNRQHRLNVDTRLAKERGQ
ncbi:hypothetical protein JCM11641_007960 [Rhodosporidiobolus odoratus]